MGKHTQIKMKHGIQKQEQKQKEKQKPKKVLESKMSSI